MKMSGTEAPDVRDDHDDDDDEQVSLVHDNTSLLHFIGDIVEQCRSVFFYSQ